MVDLLRKRKRLPFQIRQMVQLTSRMEYFQSVNAKKTNQENELHKKICQHMIFSKKLKGTFVYCQNQLSDFFYIIMSGSVVVLVDTPELEGKSTKNAIYASMSFTHPHSTDIPSLDGDLFQASRRRQRYVTVRSLLIIRLFQRIAIRVINTIMFIKSSAVNSIQRTSVVSPSRLIATTNKPLADGVSKTAQPANKVTIVKQSELYQEPLYKLIKEFFDRQNDHIHFKDIKYHFRLFDGNILKDSMYWPMRD